MKLKSLVFLILFLLIFKSFHQKTIFSGHPHHGHHPHTSTGHLGVNPGGSIGASNAPVGGMIGGIGGVSGMHGGSSGGYGWLFVTLFAFELLYILAKFGLIVK